MTERNRFSRLLSYLLSLAELKNSSLAEELQYDVSYISKWISGRMLPSEKTEKKVLDSISKFIVEKAEVEAKENLLSEYQVDNLEDLKMAIYDNLAAECTYVRELQKNTGLDIAPKSFFYPELSMSEFISKMRHPVLRRVRSLEVVAAMDLMSISHDMQLQIIQMDRVHMPKTGSYSEVHYSMLIHIRPEKWDYIYDTIFLIYLLNCNAYVDFYLYGDEQSGGRIIFSVKDEYMVCGMLISNDRCISVNVSEEADNCKPIYQSIKSLCNKERLLFRKTTMKDMVDQDEYIQSLMSIDPRWVMGHMTEHFLPDELFEEIVGQLREKKELLINEEKLRKIQQMKNHIMRRSSVRILIYKTAFYKMLVSNELDFYNHKVQLTPEQCSRYLEHMVLLCKECPNMEIRLVNHRYVRDFEYNDSQCIMLSDTLSYLRLEKGKNNLLVINRFDMRKIFAQSFEEFWDYGEEAVEKDRARIITYMEHVNSVESI